MEVSGAGGTGAAEAAVTGAAEAAVTGGGEAAELEMLTRALIGIPWKASKCPAVR
jgi:hypothetical protein